MKSHESSLESDKIWENPSKIRSKMELKSPFKIKTDYTPSGDQPNAIKELTKGINNKEKSQILLGVTGSGKTFTMAQIIEKCQKPSLILLLSFLVCIVILQFVIVLCHFGHML